MLTDQNPIKSNFSRWKHAWHRVSDRDKKHLSKVGITTAAVFLSVIGLKSMDYVDYRAIAVSLAESLNIRTNNFNQVNQQLGGLPSASLSTNQVKAKEVKPKETPKPQTEIEEVTFHDVLLDVWQKLLKIFKAD